MPLIRLTGHPCGSQRIAISGRTTYWCRLFRYHRRRNSSPDARGVGIVPRRQDEIRQLNNKLINLHWVASLHTDEPINQFMVHQTATAGSLAPPSSAVSVRAGGKYSGE